MQIYYIVSIEQQDLIMKILTWVCFIAAMVLTACTDSSTDAPTDQCYLDGADSTLTCGDNHFIVY